MNTLIIPLIGADKANWFPAAAEHLSCLEIFCRLFLAPPDSELRKAEAVPVIKSGWEPNGFLVVDEGGELLIRISKYITQALEQQKENRRLKREQLLERVDDASDVSIKPQEKILDSWARLLAARRPIATVWKAERVSVKSGEGSGSSGGQTAEDLVRTLKGRCDAVVAFEEHLSSFCLRKSEVKATAVTALYPSCELNCRQGTLLRTWDWGKDEKEHCEWLGIHPRDLKKRNQQIIGNALMFESQIIIVDQYIAHTLCRDLLSKNVDPNWAFKNYWGPLWIESLSFLLSAWQKAARVCGNRRPRTCTLVSAVNKEEWQDVLWLFIDRAERYLSDSLKGEVRFDIRIRPAKSQGQQGKRVREEMHPRFIFASTRVIQSDKGFDFVNKRQQKSQLKFFLSKIKSLTCNEMSNSRNFWMDPKLIVIPRKEFTDAELANYKTREWAHADYPELAYRQSQPKPLGETGMTLAETLNEQVVRLLDEGKYAEAEPLALQAREVSLKENGPDHPDTAANLNNLAVLYEAQEKYDLAEPLYKWVLTIDEKVLGPNHADTAMSLGNLAGVYVTQGKYELAEPLYKRAIAILDSAFGESHPNMILYRANLDRMTAYREAAGK